MKVSAAESRAVFWGVRKKEVAGWAGIVREDGGCEVVTEEEIPTQNAAQTWPPASYGELRLAGFPL